MHLLLARRPGQIDWVPFCPGWRPMCALAPSLPICYDKVYIKLIYLLAKCSLFSQVLTAPTAAKYSRTTTAVGLAVSH